MEEEEKGGQKWKLSKRRSPASLPPCTTMDIEEGENCERHLQGHTVTDSQETEESDPEDQDWTGTCVSQRAPSMYSP